MKETNYIEIYLSKHEEMRYSIICAFYEHVVRNGDGCKKYFMISEKTSV